MLPHWPDPALMNRNQHAAIRAGIPAGPTKTATASHPPSRSHQNSPPLSTTRRRTAKHPQPGSLMHRMQQHADLPLFVRPLMWTDTHSRLLGIQFLEQAPPQIDPSLPPSAFFSKCRRPKAGSRAALHRTLDTLFWNPVGVRWDNTVCTLLGDMFPGALDRPETDARLGIYFGGRLFQNIALTQLLWNHAPPDATPYSVASSQATLPADSFVGTPPLEKKQPRLPLMVYSSRSSVHDTRLNSIKVPAGPGKVANTPVLRLRLLRGKQMLPAHPDHDAHVAGILLALAQAYSYRQLSSADTTPPSSIPASQNKDDTAIRLRDVKVHFLVDNRSELEFVVYKATVTAPFLAQFHFPSRSFSSFTEDSEMPGMVIQYSKVALWPLETFALRLGLALGNEVVGQLEDPRNIADAALELPCLTADPGDNCGQPWDEVESENGLGQKRKREPECTCEYECESGSDHSQPDLQRGLSDLWRAKRQPVTGDESGAGAVVAGIER